MSTNDFTGDPTVSNEPGSMKKMIVWEAAYDPRRRDICFRSIDCDTDGERVWLAGNVRGFDGNGGRTNIKAHGVIFGVAINRMYAYGTSRDLALAALTEARTKT